jgi:hypothetical protein
MGNQVSMCALPRDTVAPLQARYDYLNYMRHSGPALQLDHPNGGIHPG